MTIKEKKPSDAVTPAKGSANSPLSAPRPDSKIGKVVALLEREEGATLDELITATGWQVHTARAALTGLKKRGYDIERRKRDDVSVYRAEARS